MRENEERWRELCAKAAVEQDPEKLHELVKEIVWLLELKEQRLRGMGKPVKVLEVPGIGGSRKAS
jgi:hypothetical protein